MPNLTDNADETDMADVADEIEANVINEIAAADKVIVINKPAKAEEADADKANESMSRQGWSTEGKESRFDDGFAIVSNLPSQNKILDN